jgi:hypothetical protein
MSSGVVSAFLLAPIRKRDFDLRTTAIRFTRVTVAAIGKSYGPLKVPGTKVHAYLAGLIALGPCERKQYRLGFGRKQKRWFAGAQFYAPTR